MTGDANVRPETARLIAFYLPQFHPVPENDEVIRRSRCFVGIDSGPSHFANAFCRPSVILLGDYGGFHGYMPYSGAFQEGGIAEILRAEGPAANLSVEEVWAALMRKLSEN